MQVIEENETLKMRTTDTRPRLSGENVIKLNQRPITSYWTGAGDAIKQTLKGTKDVDHSRR